MGLALRSNMSSSTSESDTLLASPDERDFNQDTSRRKEIDQPDRPTRFGSFARNITVCKWLLGLAVPASLALEIAHLVLLLSAVKEEADGVDQRGDEERWEMQGEIVIDAIGVGLTVSARKEFYDQ